MHVKKYRLHVGNLPDNVTESDVAKKFRKYGVVKGSDIKHRKEALTDKILSTYSFVDLETDDANLQKCLQTLNGFQWDSQYLVVGLAKESFLQRLQREREAVQNPSADSRRGSSSRVYNSTDAPSIPFSHNNIDSNTFSSGARVHNNKFYINSPQSHGEHKHSASKHSSTFKPSEQYENKNKLEALSEKSGKNRKTISPGHMASGSLQVLKKLESFSNVWKDASDSPEETCFSVDSESESEEEEEEEAEQSEDMTTTLIRSKHQETLPTIYQEKLAVPLANLAEQRRIKSLTERQKTFEEQKKAIQLALSEGKVQVNKKVVFDDSDEEDNFSAEASTIEPNKVSLSRTPFSQSFKSKTLFDESDEEASTDKWQDDFKIRKQFEGRKGKQLLNLQSRFNNDERFTLDERFLEEEEQDSSAGKSLEDGHEQNEESAAERNQQFQILSDVLGQPLLTSKVSQESSAKAMVRFDPTKPNHMKYEVSKDKKEKKVKGSIDFECIKNKVQRIEKEPEPVSKETFYKVSESLAEAFKGTKDTQPSGFSLLQMFGPSVTETVSEKSDNRKSIQYNNDMLDHANPNMLRPGMGLEDIGSHNEEFEDKKPGPSNKTKTKSSQWNSKSPFSKSIVQQESFFFQPDDNRLKEGDDFFATNQGEPLDFCAFKQKRRELRRLVNRKIQRNAIRASAFKTKLGGKPRTRTVKPRVGVRRR